ncbi:MAG: hypothetical protein P1U40_06010 [Coxiellaceae bacterium]|nr:hypothetical protein [Coxiellaceae bacterium]
MSSDNAAVAGISVGAISLIGLLITTCVILTPLGNRLRGAKGQRDKAKKVRDTAARALQTAKDHLTEAHKRVNDLTCAIQGYVNFNQHVSNFSAQIADSAQNYQQRLAQFWNLHFAPDRVSTDHHVRERSYTTSKYKYETFWGCGDAHCHQDDNSCCYAYDGHWVTKTHYYNEVTTVTNHFNNIANGGGINEPSLRCGYYARTFGTDTANTYVTRETTHKRTGRKESGNVYIDYERFYGSQLTATFTLDGATHNQPFLTNPDIPLDSTGSHLAKGLAAFLAGAVTQFTATGANYPALQQRIVASIPQLEQNVATATDALAEAAKALAEKQQIVDTANAPYQHGLKLWLPLLFLAPCAAVVVTYFCYRGGDKVQEAIIEHRARNFVPLPTEPAYRPPSPPTPPAYNPEVSKRPPATAPKGHGTSTPDNDTTIAAEPPPPSAPPYDPNADGNQQPVTPKYG